MHAAEKGEKRGGACLIGQISEAASCMYVCVHACVCMCVHVHVYMCAVKNRIDRDSNSMQCNKYTT